MVRLVCFAFVWHVWFALVWLAGTFPRSQPAHSCSFSLRRAELHLMANAFPKDAADPERGLVLEVARAWRDGRCHLFKSYFIFLSISFILN